MTAVELGLLVISAAEPEVPCVSLIKTRWLENSQNMSVIMIL
jgi:hypothetical protein